MTDEPKWEEFTLHKYYGGYQWGNYKVETSDGGWDCRFNNVLIGNSPDLETAKSICEEHNKLIYYLNQ